MKRGLFASIFIASLLWLTIACKITVAGETKHYFYFCVVGDDTLRTVTDSIGVECIRPDSIDLDGRISGWVKVKGSIRVQGNDTLFLPDPPNDPRITPYYVSDFIKINGH